MTSDNIRDFSFDIETLGKNRGAVILSIGCVQFDRKTGKTGAEFYAEIDLPSAIKCGEIDADTLRWWTADDRGPLFAKLVAAGPEKLTYATALDRLASWMRNASAGIPVVKGSLGAGTPHVWGNGATFDITLLEEGYRTGAYGLTEPWNFRHIRDMRTIIDAARWTVGDPEWWPDVKQVGTSHNALDDAKYQALCIAACFKAIGGKAAPAKQTSKPAVTIDDDDL